MKKTSSLTEAHLGALNDHQLAELIKQKYVLDFQLRRESQNGYEGYKDIDGSAINLHLSAEAWTVESTAKLKDTQKVDELIRDKQEIKLDREALKTGEIYIIRLKERIVFGKFPSRYGLHGRASGKSSVGRLDVLTRLILDYSSKYDEIPPDYDGKLYIEVVPLSFDIRLREGISLNQLRVFHGKPQLSRISAEELGNSSPMVYKLRGQPIISEQEILRANLEPDETIKSNARIIAFEAKKGPKPVDLRKGYKSHSPKRYWKAVERNGNEDLPMKKERFYIIRSLERMFLPNDIGVTCVAYTENLGELRIHYAGFAHPNFGRNRKDKKVGTPLIFEARCHSFDVTIRNEEQFARIEYYRMSEPTSAPSGYSDQELKLSNYFRPWN